jgi:hypothetical protein
VGGTLTRDPAEALASAQEAVAIHRELAAAYRGRYRSDLATSLLVFARALDALSRPEEAEAARCEAELMS